VHHIAQIRMLMGEIAVVHAFAQSANPTMGGPSDLVVNLASPTTPSARTPRATRLSRAG